MKYDTSEFKALDDLVNRSLKTDDETKEKLKGKSLKDIYQMSLEDYLDVTEKVWLIYLSLLMKREERDIFKHDFFYFNLSSLKRKTKKKPYRR